MMTSLFGSAQIDCWDPGKKTRNTEFGVSLQVFGGGDFVQSALSTTDTEMGFLNARENSSTFLGAYKTGAMLKVHFFPRIFVKGGVEYKNITERFDFEESEEITDIQEQVVSIEVDEDGNETEILGNVLVSTLLTTTYEIFNTFEANDMVIMLGYKLVSSPRFDVNLEGGITYNFNLKHDGLNIESDLQPKRVDTSYYVDNTGLGYIGGIDAGMLIGSRLRLYVALQGKIIPGSIAHELNPITQKLSFGGGALGLEFIF